MNVDLNRWWSLPFGIGLVVIGVFIQPPYPFLENGEGSRLAFIVGGAMLMFLPVLGSGSRRYRSITATIAVLPCAMRSAILIFGDKPMGIPWQSKIVGAIAWMLLGIGIAEMIVMTWPAMHHRRVNHNAGDGS